MAISGLLFLTPSLQAGALTLKEAQERALRESPRLAALEAAVGEAGLQEKVVTRRTNPELSFEFENIWGTGSFSNFEEGEYTVVLTQALSLGGKREALGRLAALTTEEREMSLEILRHAVRAEARRRWVGLMRAQESLQQARERLEISEQVVQTIEDQRSAGASSGMDFEKAKVARSLARMRLQKADQVHDKARRSLSLLWNASAPDFATAEGHLDPAGNLPELEYLKTRLASGPRWRALDLIPEFERRRREVARSRRWPDVSLSAGYRKFDVDGSHAFLVGLSVPLPLFDNGRYAVMAATKALHQAENERRAVELKLLNQLQSAWNDLRNAHLALGTLRSETLPDANRAYQMAEEGYRIGRYDYLYLLDAQRTLFDVKEQALDSMARYHLAVADLEGLIGESLFTREEVSEGHLK